MFNVIANEMVKTEDQLSSDIRIYCDNDEFGPGKRWTITPNDPDDPVYVKNDQLPRLKPKGAPDTTPLQQWQDETNWIRMSRGTMGCMDPAPTAGETQHIKFTSARTPKGINPDRVAMTVSLLGVHTVKSADQFRYVTTDW